MKNIANFLFIFKIIQFVSTNNNNKIGNHRPNLPHPRRNHQTLQETSNKNPISPQVRRNYQTLHETSNTYPNLPQARRNSQTLQETSNNYPNQHMEHGEYHSQQSLDQNYDNVYEDLFDHNGNRKNNGYLHEIFRPTNARQQSIDQYSIDNQNYGYNNFLNNVNWHQYDVYGNRRKNGYLHEIFDNVKIKEQSPESSNINNSQQQSSSDSYKQYSNNYIYEAPEDNLNTYNEDIDRKYYEYRINEDRIRHMQLAKEIEYKIIDRIKRDLSEHINKANQASTSANKETKPQKLKKQNSKSKE